MINILENLDSNKNITFNYNNESIRISGVENGICISKKSDGSVYIKNEVDYIDLWINGIKYEKDEKIIINIDDRVEIKRGEEIIDSINEDSNNIKLPWGEPMVKTYPYFTGINSILKGYDKDEAWIFNNYFLIWMLRFAHFSEYWADFKFGNEEKQENFCMQLDKEVIKREEVIEPILFIKKCIESRRYIFISLDMFYIPEWWSGENKKHTKHQSFVSGYNDEKQVLFISDFMGNGKYQTVQVGYENFLKAYDDWKKDENQCRVEYGNDIWLLSVNKKKEQIDIKRIFDWCVDSLEGTDTRIENYLWWSQKSYEVAYGKNYFDEYKKALKEMDDNSWFDGRPVHIINEFGKVMYKRIEYMIEQGIIKNSRTKNKALQSIARYTEKSEKLQNMGLKYLMQRDAIMVEKMINELDVIKEDYKKVVKQVMQVCKKDAVNV